MQKWEYDILTIPHYEVSQALPILDDMGKLGWEVVGVVVFSYGSREYTLKRPIEEIVYGDTTPSYTIEEYEEAEYLDFDDYMDYQFLCGQK